MLVTLDGIVTDVRPLQPENAEAPMLVTLEGIVNDVRPLQFQNATLLINLTPSGIFTEDGHVPLTPIKKRPSRITKPSGALFHRAVPENA